MLPLEFRSAGRRRLKGIREPVQLYRVDLRAQATSARRSATHPALSLGVAAALAITLAIVAVAAPDEPLTPAPTASNETTAASPAAEVARTHDLFRFQELGEFPNPIEAALLDHLASSVASRCERADRDETPEFHFGVTRAGYSGWIPLETPAGLDCLTDVTRVFYWQASGTRLGVGTADELFFNVASRLLIEPAAARRKAGSTNSGVRGLIPVSSSATSTSRNMP